MTARFVCMQFGKLGLGVEGGRRTVSLNLEKKASQNCWQAESFTIVLQQSNYYYNFGLSLK